MQIFWITPSIVIAALLLTAFLRKKKFIRENNGWKITKDDFKIRWTPLLIIMCALIVVFYLLYKYSVQFS